jgi:sensor histidine kinase YesM
MLIQPFVENAIHHGIGPSEKPGKLKISFSESDQLLRCTIEDNGIGINKSQSQKGAKMFGNVNFGIRITQERIKMLRNQYGDQLQIKISDKEDSASEDTGTTVEVFLPSSFN